MHPSDNGVRRQRRVCPSEHNVESSVTASSLTASLNWMWVPATSIPCDPYVQLGLCDSLRRVSKKTTYQSLPNLTAERFRWTTARRHWLRAQWLTICMACSSDRRLHAAVTKHTDRQNKSQQKPDKTSANISYISQPGIVTNDRPNDSLGLNLTIIRLSSDVMIVRVTSRRYYSLALERKRIASRASLIFCHSCGYVMDFIKEVNFYHLV